MQNENTNKQQASRVTGYDQDNQFFNSDGEKEPRSNYSAPGGNEKTFNLLVDEVPYIVKAVPFSFNGETRFYISVNNGDDHVFTWDSEVGQLRAIDDAAGILPEALEEAISRKLQS